MSGAQGQGARALPEASADAPPVWVPVCAQVSCPSSPSRPPSTGLSCEWWVRGTLWCLSHSGGRPPRYLWPPPAGRHAGRRPPLRNGAPCGGAFLHAKFYLYLYLLIPFPHSRPCGTAQEIHVHFWHLPTPDSPVLPHLSVTVLRGSTLQERRWERVRHEIRALGPIWLRTIVRGSAHDACACRMRMTHVHVEASGEGFPTLL